MHHVRNALLLMAAQLLVGCGSEDPRTEYALAPEQSNVAVTVDGEVADVGATDGVVVLRGEGCPGTECSVMLTRVQVDIEDFPASDFQVRDASLYNVATFSGTEDADGRIVFDRVTAAILFRAVVDGEQVDVPLYLEEEPTARIDGTGRLELELSVSGSVQGRQLALDALLVGSRS